MSTTSKSTRVLKIKRPQQKKPSIPDNSPRHVTLKIAKKLGPYNKTKPQFGSIQEDFLFENEENPLNFLSTEHPDTNFEVISRPRSLSPNIVGPKRNYAISKIKSELRKPSVKYHLTLLKLYQKHQSPSLEESLSNRQKAFQQVMDSGKHPQEKLPEKNLLKQSKSLENFENYSVRWKKIEQNMADTLEKMPEDLRLNAGKTFALKIREAEVIERFNKINEIGHREYWKNSLRQEGFEENYFKPGTVDHKKSVDLKKQQNSQLRNTKVVAKQKTLKGSEYFQEKLKKFEKFTEELNVDQEVEFLVKGTDKIKLEYEAAKKIGKQYVNLPPIEPYTDHTLYKHYDIKSFF